MLTKKIIKKVPKVELHDHLDGGLRISTIIELSKKYNIEIPTNNEKELSKWFVEGCKRKSLALYLQTFAVTVSVLQTEEALERCSYEAVCDLAKENVVYAEIRFAPSLHIQKGLNMEQVVNAVLKGLKRGEIEKKVRTGLLLCAMRSESPSLSLEIAELAVAFSKRGVVGFDLAGDEFGHPPKKHIEAFKYIRNKNFNITIHAGEAFGPESIWQAIQICGAHRIGHGTRLIEDIAYTGTTIKKMGSLAQYIKDKRVPMEMCITSNIGTGAAQSFETHPFELFFRNNFRVFLSTDNRLMSDTTLTDEYYKVAKAFNLTLKDMEKITINAMKSAFIHHDEKLSIIYDSIKSQYAEIKKELNYV